MLQGHSSVFQALLGTFFTWGMTAAGAALVFIFSSGQRRILDGSLGFAAGVMLAASYWSLLAPAVEMAASSGAFGAFACFPVAVGFTLGAAFVYLADLLMPHLGAEDPQTALALSFDPALMKKSDAEGPRLLFPESELSIRIDKSENGEAHQRKKPVAASLPEGPAAPAPSQENLAPPGSGRWRRIALLILAITIHNVPAALKRRTCSLANHPRRPQRVPQPWLHDTGQAAGAGGLCVCLASNLFRIEIQMPALATHAWEKASSPEGLAVGVGFGAIGKTASATFESARNLAIGIGIQNFPEGLAVSLPLRGAGFSTWRAFWYGQLSGMVEPLAGVFGAFAVVLVEPILPYALAFAAGAMVYVVMDDIIPEAQISGNGKLASWTSILGFVVMMSLDVGLG
ncbi:zinc transporter ZIP11 isoform X2 [Manis pentadactyla]|uniref:zinc transporter ZIP11 isoform X2 n=1 Tax=Manis pentadactyla TaxID=143292 RepID=UPI00255CDE0B|nr:zinc transporter ZIP11 isoform X2 [Manis pentadactyla]